MPNTPRVGKRLSCGIGVGLIMTLACSGGGGGDAGGGGTTAASVELETHVQTRVAFGPDAWTDARIAALGVDGFLDEQLAPVPIDDSAVEDQLANEYDTLDLTYAELYSRIGDMGRPAVLDLMEARLIRSVHSRRQLEQALVDFWYNHFNVFALDGFNNYVVVSYERDAIRPHALGSFRDLLPSHFPPFRIRIFYAIHGDQDVCVAWIACDPIQQQFSLFLKIPEVPLMLREEIMHAGFDR